MASAIDPTLEGSLDDLGASVSKPALKTALTAAKDEITALQGGVEDGDTLIVDYVPTNYTRTITPVQVTSETELTAHLAGIDAELASAGGGGGGGDMEVSTYDPAGIAQQLVGLTATQTLTNKSISGASNTIAGDRVTIAWVPSNYSRTTTPAEAQSITDLTAHLAGIDSQLTGGGGGAAFVNSTHTVWVSEIGDDADDGLSPDQGKLTIGAAITAASALTATSGGRAQVYSNSAATFTEDLTVPADVDVFMPSATIVGEHTITGGGNLECYALYPGAGDTVVLTKSGTASSKVETKFADLRGTGGSETGCGLALDDTGGDPFVIEIDTIWAAQDSIVFTDGGGSDAANVIWEGAVCYLAGNNAQLLDHTANGSEFNLTFEQVTESGSPTGTIGVGFDGSTTGAVRLDGQVLSADTAWEDKGSVTLKSTVAEVTGTKGAEANLDVTRLITQDDLESFDTITVAGSWPTPVSVSDVVQLTADNLDLTSSGTTLTRSGAILINGDDETTALEVVLLGAPGNGSIAEPSVGNSFVLAVPIEQTGTVTLKGPEHDVDRAANRTIGSNTVGLDSVAWLQVGDPVSLAGFAGSTFVGSIDEGNVEIDIVDAGDSPVNSSAGGAATATITTRWAVIDGAQTWTAPVPQSPYVYVLFVLTCFEAPVDEPPRWVSGERVISLENPPAEVVVPSRNVSGAVVIDIDDGAFQTLTMTGNVSGYTFTSPAAENFSKIVTVEWAQDGTGSRTLAHPAAMEWSGGTAHTVTATASAKDIVSYMVIGDSTRLIGSVVGQDVKTV